MRRARIGTFNIHTPRDERRREVAAMIARSGAAVVCLQECHRGALEPLMEDLERLTGAAWSGAWAPADFHGNGIVSRPALRDVRRHFLRPRLVRAEGRSALAATLDVGGGLRICATHLDHVAEPARLAQWRVLAGCGDVWDLLCGDLNALNPKDLNRAQRRRVAEQRLAARWEPPLFALMEAILVGAGYPAARPAAGVGGPVEGTCRFGTRVDYLLAAPDFRGRFLPGTYAQLPARREGASDHDLVCADVRL